jgi:hypothetical protein
LVELKYIKQSEITPNTGKSLVKSHVKQAKVQLEQYAQDSKLPKDTIKIVALTTNEELLALTEV